LGSLEKGVADANKGAIGGEGNCQAREGEALIAGAGRRLGLRGAVGTLDLAQGRFVPDGEVADDQHAAANRGVLRVTELGAELELATRCLRVNVGRAQGSTRIADDDPHV